MSDHQESSLAWKHFSPYALLCLVGVLLYAHTLQAPFYLDDNHAIVGNPQIKDLHLALQGVLSRRGLASLTLAVNYRFGELQVAGYHLVNIAIHLGASCLVLLLMRRIFPGRHRLQLFGALLFAAHPLQTQGVTYIVQRMTSLSALLFLLALYAFARAGEARAAGAAIGERRHLCWYAGALMAGGLAILAKEIAVVLPLALLLFARLFSPVRDRRWRPVLIYIAPFAVFPILAVVCYLLWPLAASQSMNTTGHSGLLRSMQGNSPLNYLATQCSVLWIYLRMFFVPYGQALDHGYPVAREWLTLQTAAGFCGLAGLGALAWRLRRVEPAASFAIGWFFITLTVESSIIPLDPLFEHRLYLPLFGLSVGAAALLARFPRPAWQAGVGLAVLLALSFLTWQRNALWNDPVAFYEDNLRVAPDNERVYYNLGQEYIVAGRLDEGERMIRESIALNPRRHFGYAALKELYLLQDRLDEAIGMLHYGVDHVEEKGPLYNELAFVYGKKGDFDMAIRMLQRAIEVAPQVPETYFNLAQMLMFAGDPGQVERYLHKTLELDPRHAGALEMLGNFGARTGQPASAPTRMNLQERPGSR